jgi:hypothetical protein
MRIIDVYLSLKARVEQNLTNGGVSLDKPRFVMLFNESTLKYVDDILTRKADDGIKDIQRLIREDVSLERRSSSLHKVTFSLPSDYRSFANVWGVAESTGSNKCKASDFLLWEAKLQNTHELLFDEFNKPSFRYRETFYTIGGDGISVYTDDFTMASLYMTYYRQPLKIDIEGYTGADGRPSVNIDPEFEDNSVVRIMDIAVKEFHKNVNELEKLQADMAAVYGRR